MSLYDIGIPAVSALVGADHERVLYVISST